MTTRLPGPSVTPVGLQMASGGRRFGTGTRRGTALAASRLARIRLARGCGRLRRGADRSRRLPRPAFSCANLITWARVGKSRSLRFSSRGMLIRRSHRREHLRLLDGVDAEVRFEIQIQIQHVLGIAGLLGHDLQHSLFDRVVRWRRSGSGDRRRGAGADTAAAVGAGGAAPARSGRLSYTNRMTCAKVGKSRSLRFVIARNVVGLANAGEHLRLLDRVDAEIRFEIQIQIQHVRRIAGLFRQPRPETILHRIAARTVIVAGTGIAAGAEFAAGAVASGAAGVGAGASAPMSGRRSCTNRITWASVGNRAA